MKFRRFVLWNLFLPAALLLAACGGTAKPADGQMSKTVGLTIDARELTAAPAFIDVEQDGTAMQVIAFRNDAGEVRLAFNTCQSCGGSPYAWFEDLGDGRLQCQNCRQTFPLDSVGTTDALGCSPVTITDFTVDGDTVSIPETLLQANTERFANWKKFD